jgi:outer membrane receptor protein involved in Fe transport
MPERTKPMRVQSAVSWVIVVGALTSWSPRAGVSQQLALTARTPRFFYASSTDARPVEIDVSRDAVLGRVVSLHVEQATIGGLLADIQRQSGLTFAYDPEFPVTRPVTLEAESITVAAALAAILVGTDVDVVLTPTHHVWLTESKPPTYRVQEGAIVGRVTDKRTGDPIIGATVTLDPSSKTATTGSDGRYRFVNLDAGSYTVRARYIGFTSLLASVDLSAGEEATVDFPLDRSAQPLEQVVVTGTVVPTAVKALPSPVSVIGETEIDLQHPHTVQQLFRQAVPAAVGWEYAAYPQQTSLSVRGASTLSPGSGQMKVFVDGIEAASNSYTAIDPNSIERIEVVRGPQAAAIYGSDAIGGVIQVFTKRGDPSLERAQVSAQGALGVIQTPYTGYGSASRQDYSASVRSAGSDVSYNFGATYTRTGEYVPGGKQSNPSVYGGMRFARGIISADISGRYYTQNAPQNVFNPDLAQTGFFFFSKPFIERTQVQNQTVGARFGVAATNWWHSTVTAGVDRSTVEFEQLQPRLTTPSDTLLQLFNRNQTKIFIGASTSLQGSLNRHLAGSVALGVDHYSLPSSQFATFGALTTTGAVRTAPGQSITLSRSTTENTGYFAQAQIGFNDVLFLTGGLRAEESSDFGSELGTPVSPRAGVSYVQPVGDVSVKIRGSYGRAIRAPSPGQKFAILTGSSATLANPELGPERQRGWDAGVDLVFKARASLSVTYFDQTADNLIQQVLVQSTPQPTYQYQNVGRVANSGIEVEAMLSAGLLSFKGQYGYVRSRIEQLAPDYTGDLRVGDQSLATPKHTAGGSLTLVPTARTTLVTGVTYVGRWNYYDYLAEFRCFGGTGPCQPTFRDYIIAYPAFVKLNARLSQQIRPWITAVLSVDNLTNNGASELNNLIPVMGRVTVFGLQFEY